MRDRVDVAVLGGGFGGSLLAILVRRIGLSCVLVERAAHPRFAIGESATPTADLVLRDLAARYDLPWLGAFSRYGSWRREHPEVRCGPKRGFSYFAHVAGEPFRPDPEHHRELLVAASRDEENADTHWLRADVDHFLLERARKDGVDVHERTRASLGREGDEWRLDLATTDGRRTVRARFLVDATGEGRALAGFLRLTDEGVALRTNSRALYAHFEEVPPWEEIVAGLGGEIEKYPVPCDQAAQHHLLEEGWLWQLRFDHGVTSVGLAIDAAAHPLDPSISAEEEWAVRLRRYPSLAAQLAGSRLVAPEGGLRRTARMQRRVETAAGPGWALLPGAAAFVDPLHSTGIAQTLCGAERLASIFQRHGPAPPAAELRRYDETVHRETSLIDELVSGAYQARGDFRLLTAFSMLYFGAATTWEHRRLDGTLPEGAGFLCADDPDLRERISALGVQLGVLLRQGPLDERKRTWYENQVARIIEPYNRVGLCDPSARNLYRYTALP